MVVPANRIIYLTDRSAVEADDICGMKYWWNRKEGGGGIVPREEAVALAIGRETHEDLHAVALMEDLRPEAIQEVISDLLGGVTEDDHWDTGKMEILYRRVGWLAAFALYIEPAIRARYLTLSTESEIILDRDPLYVAVTPDRLLEERFDHHLEYREYKSTITANTKWMMSWTFAIQLHLGLAAVMEEIGREVKFAQIQALMKGDKSRLDDTLVHPYVWGYYHAGSHKWVATYKEAGSAGWARLPVWEYPGTVVEWVRDVCGPEIALTQFPLSNPVFINPRMLDRWCQRRRAREAQIRAVTEVSHKKPEIRGVFFEERTRNCRPAFGDPCPYLKACWNAEVNADPLGSGEYIPRIPHHEEAAILEALK